MARSRFEGWYFKHQKGNRMLAFIPGRSAAGDFVQMMSPQGARQFPVKEITVENGVILAGKCRFSAGGCEIDLPGVCGELTYGPLQPLRSDIMGPFRFLPMECRHGIISMDHGLAGTISQEGRSYDFDGGAGYIEMDSGISFPSDYLWMQCNTFPEKCSIMVSVANIPLGPGKFRGCICAIIHGGCEYRFATYNGVRLRTVTGEHLCLTQGKFLLEIDMQPRDRGHVLASPVKGVMSGAVRECCNASVRVRLWEAGKLIFDLSSDAAAYEWVPPGGICREE